MPLAQSGPGMDMSSTVLPGNAEPARRTTAPRSIAPASFPEGLAASGLQVLLALAIALVLSFPVRSVSIEINHTLGRAWPFSLAHCRTRDTPGCITEGTDRVPDNRHIAGVPDLALADRVPPVTKRRASH